MKFRGLYWIYGDAKPCRGQHHGDAIHACIASRWHYTRVYCFTGMQTFRGCNNRWHRQAPPFPMSPLAPSLSFLRSLSLSLPLKPRILKPATHVSFCMMQVIFVSLASRLWLGIRGVGVKWRSWGKLSQKYLHILPHRVQLCMRHMERMQ